MKSPRPTLAGVYLLALASLASSASLVRHADAIGRGRTGRDDVSTFLRRLDPLRRMLPSHGTVGYEADSQDPLAEREDVRRFYLTQYAVAPVIVVAGVDRDLVIGDYRVPDRCRICKSQDFTLAADFGHGLMLFRRKAR
jgi:hypothetical protein